MTLKNRLTSILDVFSRRSAPRGQGHKPDEMSERLRNRLLLLYRDVISGQWNANPWSSPENHTSDFWEQMHNALEHLHGRVRLSKAQAQTPIEDALAFLLRCDAEEFFDFIELSFKLESTWRVMSDENQLVDAINEIFKVENAPYQLTQIVKVNEPDTSSFPGGFPRTGTVIRTVAYPKVVRAEEEVTYTEAVAPALSVLSAPHFEAANLEFRDALDEYRKGHYGDCLTKCGSAFESVMKVVCKRNGWAFDEKKETAASLLKVVVSNSTLDPFFEQPLMLIATMRNRLSSSHGGGTAVRSVERHVAQYAITSTAAAVVLLVHEVGA